MVKLSDIPVVSVGKGSQPEEADGAELEYIDLPKEISTFQRPYIPEPEEVEHLQGARQAMEWLKQALAEYTPGSEPLIANLAGLDEANTELVNQIMGDGEVSISYSGVVRAKMQESVLAGVWRTLYLDADDRILHDLIEVADVPYLVRLPAHQSTPRTRPLTDVEIPTGVMNAMAILAELEEQRLNQSANDEPHVINLTLLPLSPADVAFLEQTLGRGPVDLLSRGYGSCRVSSTSIPNIWWVRFFNSMNKLILDTIEVVDVPGVACAAAEDIADSRLRLLEILEPYWQEMS
jgi:hydrogenase-1 operon protein HyaF